MTEDIVIDANRQTEINWKILEIFILVKFNFLGPGKADTTLVRMLEKLSEVHPIIKFYIRFFVSRLKKYIKYSCATAFQFSQLTISKSTIN